MSASPERMDHQRYAETIRDRIMEAVGVPVTMGIARSKMQAKLISDPANEYDICDIRWKLCF